MLDAAKMRLISMTIRAALWKSVVNLFPQRLRHIRAGLDWDIRSSIHRIPMQEVNANGRQSLLFDKVGDPQLRMVRETEVRLVSHPHGRADKRKRAQLFARISHSCEQNIPAKAGIRGPGLPGWEIQRQANIQSHRQSRVADTRAVLEDEMIIKLVVVANPHQNAARQSDAGFNAMTCSVRCGTQTRDDSNKK